MTDEAKLTALLHVSAVVTVLTLAFLGLDTSHVDPPNYGEGFLPAELKAKNIMLRLGLNGGAVKLFGAGWWLRVKTTLLAAIICLIADDPIELGIMLRCAHFCHRQHHVPFFRYFKHSNHQRNVALVAVFSTAVFFTTAAAIVWDNNWFKIDQGWFAAFSPDWLLQSFIILEAFALVWLMVTGAALRWLQKEALEKKCERLGEEITEHLNAARARQRQMLLRIRTSLEERRDLFKRAAEDLQKRLDKMDGTGGG